MFPEGFPSFQNQLFFEKHNTSNYLFYHHFQDRNEWFDYCNLAIRLLSPSFVFCRRYCQELSRNLPGNSNILGCTMFCSCPHSYINFLSLQSPSYPGFFSSSLSFSVLPIHLFSSPVLIFLVLQVCCMCPLKEQFTHSRACNFLKATGPVQEAAFCKRPSALDSHRAFGVPVTESTINLL